MPGWGLACFGVHLRHPSVENERRFGRTTPPTPPARYVEKIDGVTIVLEVANLRPGTLYVKIGPGFVTRRDGFVPNTELPWYPVEVEAARQVAPRADSRSVQQLSRLWRA